MRAWWWRSILLAAMETSTKLSSFRPQLKMTQKGGQDLIKQSEQSVIPTNKRVERRYEKRMNDIRTINRII